MEAETRPSIGQRARRAASTLTDGRRLAGDVLLVAAGITPNIELAARGRAGGQRAA